MTSSPEFLHLNNKNSLHPPMKNVVGNTYAETRAEIEARKKAEQEAEMLKFASEPPASEPPKKSSVWFAVLTIIFLIVALAGVGFGVFEYFENESLKTKNDQLTAEYDSLKTSYETQKSLYEELLVVLDSQEKSEETPAPSE